MNNILIVGSGGREHALAWKLKQSPRLKKIFIAPGNAGTAQVGINVDIKATDFEKLIEFAKKENISLTVVGPDDPLALGIVDAFQNQGLRIWGPTKKAAQIEASKAFAKELMKKNRVPTADFETFHDYDKALAYVKEFYNPSSLGEGRDEGRGRNEKNITPSSTLPHQDHPRFFFEKSWEPGQGGGKNIVIKASGLALGKGVTVCKTINEAEDALKKAMVDKIFGEAGSVVVIEEFLQGLEFSTHAFCDGNTFNLLPTSQDHKPIFDGDKGPNTGGMGTIAPLPWENQNLRNDVIQLIIEPVLKGLKKMGISYTGLLYPGLIVTSHPSLSPPLKGGEQKDTPSPRGGGQRGGDIKVIEINARFGDPETQSYMRLLKTDLFDILNASVDGNLVNQPIEWHKGYAACIVLASGGYPGSYKKGLPISGIEEASRLPDIVIFHAGTSHSSPLNIRGDKGGIYTNGGRVLGVTATADDLKTALDKAYAAVKLIRFDGMHYRTDIGAKSLLTAKR